MGSKILNNKTFAGEKLEFPLDFFEKAFCITADVRLGSDAIRNGDSEGAKQSLASEDGFIESPSPMGFKVWLDFRNYFYDKLICVLCLAITLTSILTGSLEVS